MKNLFLLSLLSVMLFSSCTKDEPIVLSETTQDSVVVRPLGAVEEDPSSYKKVGFYQVPTEKLKSLPTSIDLSANLPTVGFQTGSSCVGWAVAYYAKTYMEVKEMKWDKNANIYSPMWVYNQLNGGQDYGTSISSAMNLLVSNGCDLKDNFNTTSYLTQPDQASLINANHYKAQEWKYLNRNVNELKQVLANGQVFVCGINVTRDFDELTASNPVYDDFTGGIRGGHALCIVGYDDVKQAFKVVNSWGITTWGINGFGWISYNLVTNTAYRFDAYLFIDKINIFETVTLLGDFNGDKISDIIYSTNGYGLYVSWGGKGAFKKLDDTLAPISSLAVGDFNGDGKSDIFGFNGTSWIVKYSGTGPWVTILNSTVMITDILIGDFNGDKKADVFCRKVNADGTYARYILYSGNSALTYINNSGASAAASLVGDFNGDGKDDIFAPNGTHWLCSYSGTAGWIYLQPNTLLKKDLAVGDFNGDGKADVFYGTSILTSPSSARYISYSGTAPFTYINASGMTAKDMQVGDFDGDKKADIYNAFNLNKNGYLYSSAGISGWITL